jgi:hypothetical protein
MIDLSDIQLEAIFIHQVGNKLKEEGLKIAPEATAVADDETSTYLLHYLISSFSSNEIYNFSHASELGLNEVYQFAKRLFAAPETLYQASIDIAKHLYEQTTHPKILAGDLCVCYFKNASINGEGADAIGFFKSELKDVYLKFDALSDVIKVKHENGININRLDKGCLIFNLEEEKGYKVCVIDSNRANDAQYWKNDFLNIKPAADAYHQTKDFLSLTKDYVTKQLSDEFQISKTDQIDLLNRSVNYFKTHENFDKKEFEKEIFNEPAVIESFRKFDTNYQETNAVEMPDSFEISAQAVKKQAKVFKSVLKLDKNFHIYIHGDRDLIEQGAEADGRKYYKIYFKEEN